jgi:PLP dependent protein
MQSTIKDNILGIKKNIAEAALKAGREPSGIKLMAVSKTVDDRRINEAIAAGIDMIGENYVQEAKRKIEIMGHPVAWHFIGHLQTNKTKYAVRLFDMIHSVDRLELAQELDKKATALGRKISVLMEVNVSGESTKSGVPLKEAMQLIKQMSSFKSLAVQGLMTMPPWFDDPEDARPYFVALRELRDGIIREGIEEVTMKELSMGMSGDYMVAAEEGSTIVRIGRSIFGERQIKP